MTSAPKSLPGTNYYHPMGMENPNPLLRQGDQWDSTNSHLNNKWMKHSNQTNNVRQDWSAFESLLPDQNQGNGNGNNNNVKKLDTNEMMDFLS